MLDTHHTLLLIGALSGALAVLIGGMRAHVLHRRLSPDRLAMLDVGSRYQLVHAIAILIAVMLAGGGGEGRDPALLIAAGWGFVIGILLFPCVLYAYAFTGHRALLRMSMLGGAVFVAAWVTLGASVIVV